MMKVFFFSIATAFFLAGCSSMQPQLTDSIGQSAEQAALQQDLLEPCEPLPKLEERAYTQQESFNVMKTWAVMYYNCSKKQQALAELLTYSAKESK